MRCISTGIGVPFDVTNETNQKPATLKIIAIVAATKNMATALRTVTCVFILN